MTDNIKQVKSNRVHGENWLYSGESKNYPQLLDIRYEKDYKLRSGKIFKKKGGHIKTYAKGGGVRKPKMTAGY